MRSWLDAFLFCLGYFFFWSCVGVASGFVTTATVALAMAMPGYIDETGSLPEMLTYFVAGSWAVAMFYALRQFPNAGLRAYLRILKCGVTRPRKIEKDREPRQSKTAPRP